MNRSILFGALVLAAMLAGMTHAQQPGGLAGDLYRIGDRFVRVPAPAGFTDAGSRFENMRERFTASESPDSELLAVFVQNVLVPSLEKGDDPDLEFYAKVSVLRAAKTVDFTPDLFAFYTTDLEKKFDKMLDPTGPALAPLIKNAEKGLDTHWGRGTGFDLKEPKNLGFFDKQPCIFSAMVLMNVELLEKKIPLLVSLSFVLVNKRIVYVSGYRRLTNGKDAEVLRDFTMKWTAGIVAANK
jgi:hypothetical protein